MKALIQVSRFRGVERELHRLNELLEILLNSQGIPTQKVKGAAPDKPSVGYVSDDEHEMRELLREVGRIPLDEVGTDEEE